MGNALRVAIACGGTGGHIFPGLATGQELLERGFDVTLWMAGKDVEHDAVKGWSGNIITIPSEGFQFGFSFRSLKTIFRLYRAYRMALAPMRESCPDVVLAMGSYASFGPVKAARKLGVPYVLHEANLLPGRAVSLLSRHAHTVAVSFEKSGYYLKHGNIETTGLPLRKELEAHVASSPDRDPSAPLRILVVGGSRGAQALNEVVPLAIGAAAQKGVALEVVHIAGLQDSSGVEAVYSKTGIKAEVHQFVHDMGPIYCSVDLAICRSGAATCAELALFGVPALLVPYPFAVRNHQMGNARALQDSKAADVVAQDDLSATWLCDYIISVAGNPKRLERMAAAMKKRAQPGAAGRLADLVERVAGEQP
jgi:UDP-N-acetylglucosamine--N-acetylmuramyl-(pentapeptide) pyrophosphoryl-undecaprenol N-acetylglucosamine transferase